ncbi:UNVERIFIED_CONTAM: hypothetical protein Sindi_2031600, partial [Sesamum indicum]
MEIGAISLKSKSEVVSSCSHLEDGSHLLNRHVRFGSGTIRNTQMEIQLQDLYDHFEIQINDAQVILMAASFATIPLVEKFSASANLVGCIFLDEPILKGFE